MDELTGVLNEFRAMAKAHALYIKRFDDFFAAMGAELTRQMEETPGFMDATISHELKEIRFADAYDDVPARVGHWGWVVTVSFKMHAGSTTCRTEIEQEAAGVYDLLNAHRHEERATESDGAAAMRTILGWVVGRLQRLQGDLSGGTPSEREGEGSQLN